MNVREWISTACMGNVSEYSETLDRFGDLVIAKEFNRSKSDFVEFPQKHGAFRNIHNWVLLTDGSAIGWNESPKTGYSFPRVGKKTVSELMNTTVKVVDQPKVLTKIVKEPASEPVKPSLELKRGMKVFNKKDIRLTVTEFSDRLVWCKEENLPYPMEMLRLVK